MMYFVVLADCPKQILSLNNLFMFTNNFQYNFLIKKYIVCIQ